MGRASFRSAISLITAIVSLTFGSFSVSAQYYMNVFQKDGQKFHFMVSNLDSVNFTNQTEPFDDYEYVDLGLSVNWATCNIDASEPERYGGYYAWGETNTKDSYSWSNYKYCHGTNMSLTKYCTDGSYGFNGIADNKSRLDLDDDVASVKWRGDWRIPTKGEFEELQKYCVWTWTTLDGINGYKITSKKDGYTNRSIFLSAAGYFEDTNLDGVDSYGKYWCSSHSIGSPCDSWALYFNSDNRMISYSNRNYGHSVRPVCPSATWQGITSISLNKKRELLNIGDSCTLTVTLKSGNDDYSFMSDYYDQITWSSSDESVAMVESDGKVIAVSEGTTIITATFNSFQSNCVINVTKYVFVDLGLSVKWATCNVGADRPEDFGDYFAWGETEPYYEVGYAQSYKPVWKSGKDTGYTWSSYKYCNGSDTTLTKYCIDSKYGYNGFTDSKTTLDPEDDAVHVNWGGGWRMPTIAELEELTYTVNCTWTWTTQNGVNGYLVTSKKYGYEGRSIFLPAAGRRSNTYSGGDGEWGVYWSSSLYNSSRSWILVFKSDEHTTNDRDYYYAGLTVRPVYP